MKIFAQVLCALTLVGASLEGVSAAPRSASAHVMSEFEWVDLSKCRTPRTKPPYMPADSDEEYGFERKYLALAEGPWCVLMESYVEALFGSQSTGMKVMGSRYYSFSQGKWRPVNQPFLYFPYAVRGKADGQLYFVDAVLEEDAGVKYPGASGQNPNVFIRRPVRPEERSRDSNDWVIDTYPGAHGPVLQGLAVVLHRRLRAGLVVRKFEAQDSMERSRIRFLLKAAWETLPLADRVEVDADGLPR